MFQIGAGSPNDVGYHVFPPKWRWLTREQYSVLKNSRTPSCLRLRSFIPLMYQYLSAYDLRPPMYNNTCGVERPTEPPTTVPITTIEDVIGGRCHRHVEAETTTVYKITKIVRAIWLTERRVYMRLCKHGWGVKMFCFWRANHASTNSKKFLSWKLDKFTLFAPSLVGWNSENLRKHAVSSSFCLSWHFKP